MSVDVVYYVAAEPRNEELRYSLRSLETNLPDHGRVIVAGYCPEWLTGVEHVPVKAIGQSKWRRALDNFRAALEPRGYGPAGPPEQFLLMNDDFYLMWPVGPDGFPVWHAGTTDEQIKRYGSGVCRAGMRATAQVMRAHRLGARLYSYELHVPMMMDRARAAAALQMYEGVDPFYIRTVYGNLARLGGARHCDVKVHHGDPTEWRAEWPYLSTSQRAFERGQVGRDIRDRFPVPSRYENRRAPAPRYNPLAAASRAGDDGSLGMVETDIMMAAKNAIVYVGRRRYTVRRGQTTAHKTSSVVTDYPRLWTPLVLNFPGVPAAEQAAPVSSPVVELDSGAGDAPAAAPSVETAEQPEAAIIRAWLDGQGIEHSARGRLPQALVDQYMAAHRADES